jgi:hypothetical protein
MIRSLTSFRFITAFIIFLFHSRIHFDWKVGSKLIDKFFLNGATFMTGFLNGFRTAELEKLLKNKNNFFDYSLIEEVLKFKTPRFIVQNKDTNICSLHIRKSKNWLYSSPTRYINSLEKNEIPIVLDNFNDDITSNLFLNKDFLNCKNFEKVDKYLNNLNQSIQEYIRKQEEFYNNFDKFLHEVN